MSAKRWIIVLLCLVFFAVSLAPLLNTADNCSAGAVSEPESLTRELPVLMYHHITPEGGSDMIISTNRFQEHMRVLHESGFSAVSLEQVRDFVLLGCKLPERPVLITFDDGYMSNYTEAFPVLQRYGFNAAIFVVGVSFGKNTYKETSQPITPRFGHAEALEMARSGLISIQSHSFDMHQVERFDYPLRHGVLRMDGESERSYMETFRNDHALMQELLEEISGDVFAFSFPFGHIDLLSSLLLREQGVQITFSVIPGVNTLVRGRPQTLLELTRFNMDDSISGEDLVNLLL